MSDDERDVLVSEAGAREQLASTELYRVCDPGQHFRMSIPADVNRDSDLLIGASLADIPALLAIIERDGKRLALTEKTIDAFRDWRVESDGYAGAPDHFDAILDSYDAAKEAEL